METIICLHLLGKLEWSSPHDASAWSRPRTKAGHQATPVNGIISPWSSSQRGGRSWVRSKRKSGGGGAKSSGEQQEPRRRAVKGDKNEGEDSRRD